MPLRFWLAEGANGQGAVSRKNNSVALLQIMFIRQMRPNYCVSGLYARAIGLDARGGEGVLSASPTVCVSGGS